MWRDADVDDYKRFPARTIAPPPRPTPLARKPLLRAVQLRIAVSPNEPSVPLETFLIETDTTAFIALSGGAVAYEGYFNGSSRESIQTSFSVAKSFLSALVGIAIADGYLKGVDEPVTTYLPELARRDPRFGRITLRHLLTMSSGLRYEERGLPWSDDATTYYGTDLRSVALEDTEVVGPPGERFHYNNYNALLIGLVLERVLPTTVSQYLETRVWKPIGAEARATWSLDSDGSGFEKMESGLNARAIDFARFGLAYLHGGRLNSRQVIPADWVRESTLADQTTDPSHDYQFFWWVQDGAGRTDDYYARGNHGQFIYASPEHEVVLVRFGRKSGYGGWPTLLADLASRLASD